ncbi:cupredoxin domain-containing protein [Alkalihalobacillus deserti]|uniref:cupredoxin domain-containing protein n=1 Tax=Alkalihalobacillus deserti TaxID=2879466 RepID=UPI001D15A028|nr:cupredoxin domain-containing protein [Alkalihalobacillus deserti]
MSYRNLTIYFLVGMVFMIVGCSNEMETSIEVEGRDFEYIPEEITIPKGEEITLTFNNRGNVFHNLIIEPIDISNGENEIRLEANPNQEDSITFIANKAGKYEMFCDEEGHEEMVGTLIVEE